MNSHETFEEGFKWDRRWMLVDEQGKFITQRSYPQLSLLKCSISEDQLIVSSSTSSITILLGENSDKVYKVSVWSSSLKAQEVSSQISQWFSEYLNTHCYLVKMTEISKRFKRLYKAPFKSMVSFADGYPYLILGTATLDLLNSKLESAIKIDRFRPNIIVETNKAHEEDEWEEIHIGTAILKVIKPCARCIMTTINQQTAKLGKEPLKTLASYRKKGNKIYFGANAVLITTGKISVSDSVILKV